MSPLRSNVDRMTETVDRETRIRDLLDHVQHYSDAAVHCVVEVEPDQFVVTRTRGQAEFLRGALAVLRAQTAQPAPAAPEPAPEPESSPEPTGENPEPAAPVKRGPGRPRKAVVQTGD